MDYEGLAVAKQHGERASDRNISTLSLALPQTAPLVVSSPHRRKYLFAHESCLPAFALSRFNSRCNSARNSARSPAARYAVQSKSRSLRRKDSLYQREGASFEKDRTLPAKLIDAIISDRTWLTDCRATRRAGRCSVSSPSCGHNEGSRKKMRGREWVTPISLRYRMLSLPARIRSGRPRAI